MKVDLIEEPVAIRDVPSSDGRSTYRVKVFPSGLASCECQGFAHRKRCRHIAEVRSVVDSEEETSNAYEDS